MIISHRISSIKYADRIIVIDEGRVIEQGSHQSLVDLNGAYNKIYKKQMLQAESDIEK